VGVGLGLGLVPQHSHSTLNPKMFGMSFSGSHCHMYIHCLLCMNYLSGKMTLM
jgi:hypothetical protein